MSKSNLLNPPSIITPLPWIPSRMFYNKFTTLLLEIISSDNQVLVSDKTLIRLALIKLNNSMINSMSDKTLLYQELEILKQINSTNQSINISDKLKPQFKVQYQIKNNLTLLHLLCSKETTKSQTQVQVQFLQPQVGMIQISSQ